MRISELAKKTGCTVETIRFYETNHLIPEPPRTSSNYRVYGPLHLARLIFIRHCRALDLSLDEIRSLVNVIDTPKKDELLKVHEVIESHIGSIDKKIEELKLLRGQLSELHSRCHCEDHEHGHCGLIDGLTKE